MKPYALDKVYIRWKFLAIHRQISLIKCTHSTHDILLLGHILPKS